MNNGRQIFEIVIKLILTPVLILISIALVIFHAIIGTLLFIVISIRFAGLTIYLAIKSRILKEDLVSPFFDLWYDHGAKYIDFYVQSFKIIEAFWNKESSKTSSLGELLKFEREVFVKDFVYNILIIGSLVISISFSVVYLAYRTGVIHSEKADNLKRINKELSYKNQELKDIETRVKETYKTTFGKNKGMVTFYSDCDDCANIRVWVDKKLIGIITKGPSKKPFQCAEDGTAFALLPSGEYNYKAGNSKYGWKGKFKIIEGKCVPFRLFLSPKIPLENVPSSR